MWKCKHCEKEFDFGSTSEKANHTRWCDKNPKANMFREQNAKRQREAMNDKFGYMMEFEVVCDSCDKVFKVEEREDLHPVKDQYFCTRSCSNSVGGKAKAAKYHYDEIAKYTTVAWRHHEKECVVCGEQNVVAVHHYDEDHDNNDPKNLIPLCPTHHTYMHSKFKYLIEEVIEKYLIEKWGP